jgi:opacity protein-like surface antigen
MKRVMLSAALGAALVNLCMQGAAAADLPAPPASPNSSAAVPVQRWDWSGLYLGIHGGWGFGRDPFATLVTDPTGSTSTYLNGVNSRGYIAGGHVGYNVQRGWWLAGLETDFSITGIEGQHSLTVHSPPGGFLPGAATSESFRDRFDYLSSARARVGVVPLDSLLIYLTGGAAWAHLTQDTSFATNGTFFDMSSSSSSPVLLFGWAAGGGAEASLQSLGLPNLLVRAEYLHYDFGSTGSSASVAGGIATVSQTTTGRLGVDVVRGGLSVKF